MKKHNLLKTIAIFFLVVVALSWVIPTGTIANGQFTKGTTNPVGFVDLIRLPLLTITTFFQFGLVFLAIGGFYGVLNKTGVYVPFVDRIVKRLKGKEGKFVTISIILFALLASISGLSVPLFILVPFFVTVILVMGMSKLTALASTVGAILIGMLGSTYGFSVVGYINYYFSLDVNNQMITKVILFIMLVLLLCVFVNKRALSEVIESEKKKLKEDKNELENTIPFYEPKYKNNKSAVPMITVTITAILLLLVMMFDWFHGLGVNFFQDIYQSLMGIKIGSYPIVANILGNLSQFGIWTNHELSMILIISSLLIGWIYSLKGNDTLDGFFEGAKKMVGVAFYVSICSVIFAVILSSESSTLYNTILNFILGLTKSFNVFVSAIVALVGGFFYNDFYYFTACISGAVGSTYDVGSLEVLGLALQTMYGFTMLLLPTSMILIAGLRYLEISYKEWIQYIWKFLCMIFVIIVLVLIIAMLFL